MPHTTKDTSSIFPGIATWTKNLGVGVDSVSNIQTTECFWVYKNISKIPSSYNFLYRFFTFSVVSKRSRVLSIFAKRIFLLYYYYQQVLGQVDVSPAQKENSSAPEFNESTPTNGFSY